MTSIINKLDHLQQTMDDLPQRFDEIAELACYRALDRHASMCPARQPSEKSKLPSWVRVLLGLSALLGAAVGGALGVG